MEHDLEPHRVRHLARELKARADDDGIQVFCTTHSPIILENVNVTDLAVVRSRAGLTTVSAVPEEIASADPGWQALARSAPSALLASHVVVAEGSTEVGFGASMITNFDSRNASPAALRGLAIMNGGGSEAPGRAERLARLGYSTALMIDHGDGTSQADVEQAVEAGCSLVQCSEGSCLEMEIAMSLDADGLAQLVNLAVELNESEDHEASVRDAVTERFPAAYEAPAGLPVATWIDNLDLDTLGTAIGELLDELYPQVPILLDHSDPYTLLVAVALSAQTTDKKVNQITPALFDAAGTPEKMAAMDPDEILGYIREVGLAPTKAKNLWLAANQIVDQGGEVIGDWEFLEALPGIGHKTASVVMSQAFGVPAFAVDTHVHRLADRWGLSKGTTVERTEADLKAVFPIETWNDRHLQIIFFGREYCPARRHDLATCPICSWAATKKRIRDESMR